MPKKRVALAALLSALSGVVSAQLHLVSEMSEPASMREGTTITGYSVDKVREMMTRAGIEYTIELLPWRRAYATALERPDGCVLSTTRTAARETLFKWIGPTEEAVWVLMGRADRNFRLRSLEDARGLRIGTYNGDARDQYLRERGFRVDPAQDDHTNPKKLMLNRIDLWAASLRRGGAVLKRQGWSNDIVQVLAFKQVQLYLACNPAVPDGLVARMNAELSSMARDGTLRRIERNYDGWEAGVKE